LLEFQWNIFWSVAIKHVLNFANVVSLYVAKSLGDKEIVKGLGEQKCTELSVFQWIDRDYLLRKCIP
jgi:hypothetical protein